jgi:nitroreductase
VIFLFLWQPKKGGNMILEKLAQNRSHRSFTGKEVKMEDLRKMIEGARVSASTTNSQKVRFFPVNDPTVCAAAFAQARFAGLIAWKPTSAEAPKAYIALCVKEELLAGYPEGFMSFDMGLCSQNILLVANELGYGGCIVAAYNKAEFDKIVRIPAGYKSVYIIALGEPTDTVTIVEAKNGDTKYYRDDQNHHFVPKLSVDELILK